MSIAVAAPNNATFARSLVLGMPGYALPPTGRFIAELRATTDPTQAAFADIALRFDSQIGSISVIAYDGTAQTATIALLASAQDMAGLAGGASYTADLVYIQGDDVANFGQLAFSIVQGLSCAPLPPAPSYSSLTSWGPIVDIAGASAPTILSIETQGLPGPVGPAPWGPLAAWAPTHVYSAATSTAPASAVTNAGSSYYCISTHTSGATFDASKWQEITPGAGAAVTAAAASAAAAAASQVAALGSQTSATGSALAAAGSAGSASSSATSVAALLASFRGVFLGAFASDVAATTFASANSITVAAGVMYENTAEDKFRIYSGTAWGDYDASAQASQSAASLSATNAASSAAAAAASAAAITSAGFLKNTNNLSDVSSAATSRANLGLGSAATANTGTSGAVVPFLNGANVWGGVNNYSAAFQIAGVAQSFPGSGLLVGTTDAQTLTNKTLTSPAIGGSPTITGLPTPVNASDAANKAYVDATASGLSVKPSAVCATTGALPAYGYAASSPSPRPAR